MYIPEEIRKSVVFIGFYRKGRGGFAKLAEGTPQL
jgi:hypothetical protein